MRDWDSEIAEMDKNLLITPRRQYVSSAESPDIARTKAESVNGSDVVQIRGDAIVSATLSVWS